MPPGLQRQHERARALLAWNSCDDLIAHAARQPAVVALDRSAGALREVVGELHAPLREVREHQHLLAGREHGVDDLLETRELARAARERPTVVLVRGRVVADLFECGDRREDLTLARFLALGQIGCGHERVEQRLIHTDLLGRHRAVVELVDLIGKLGRDLGFRLRTAEHEDAVQRAHRGFGLDARRATVARRAAR